MQVSALLSTLGESHAAVDRHNCISFRGDSLGVRYLGRTVRPFRFSAVKFRLLCHPFLSFLCSVYILLTVAHSLLNEPSVLGITLIQNNTT